MELDTDLLLALLSSKLNEHEIDTATLLNVLVQVDGDVQRAADLIRQPNRPFDRELLRGTKRLRDLDDWLLPDAKPRNSRAVSREYAKDHLRSKTPTSNQTSSMSSSKSTQSQAIGSSTPSRSNPETSVPIRPMTLSNSDMVASYTSCTLHTTVLPPELACRLYYTLLDKSVRWKRNKWWLFDKLVESPHRTSFFVRDQTDIDDKENWSEASLHWYNGRPSPPPERFTPEMEDACRYVETIVNEEMSKRKRFSLEWGGSTWKANVAATNCYNGSKESVGLHSDQLTYLGPYPTIASLSLGTTRKFRLREVIPTTEIPQRTAQTFDIPLVHNSLVIMHASTQENFKHSIPSQRVIDTFKPAFPRDGSGKEDAIESTVARINITFRFYRPDFKPPSIPRCVCNIPCILRPDMKGRNASGYVPKFWWVCYAGAQNDGKGCSFWKVMDVVDEERGPFIGDVQVNGGLGGSKISQCDE